jgi:hypothetical protein
MNLNISYYKAAQICNIPLFLVPAGITLSIIYGGYSGEDYGPFGDRANYMSIGFIFWVPVAAFSFVLLILSKKPTQIGRYASLISIVVGVVGAIIM